jgi:hypothetical protein
MSSTSSEQNFETLRAELLERFEAELREQQDIDAASRESMLGHLEQTLATMTAPADVNPDQIRASLDDTIGLLGQHGLLDASGADEVQRAFSDTLQVFENPSVQRALEFARISREQGEDAAREWLANATAAQRSSVI